MGTKRCSICSHPRTSEITKAVLAGGSNRIVAARFAVSTSSIQRHRVTCLRSPREAKAVEPAVAPSNGPDSLRFAHDDPQSLVKMTARLVSEALDLLEAAKTMKDTRTALNALREARDGLQLLMRAAGLLAGDGAVTIDARRQTIEVFGELTSADLRRLAALADAGDNRTLSGQPIDD